MIPADTARSRATIIIHRDAIKDQPDSVSNGVSNHPTYVHSVLALLDRTPYRLLHARIERTSVLHAVLVRELGTVKDTALSKLTLVGGY